MTKLLLPSLIVAALLSWGAHSPVQNHAPAAASPELPPASEVIARYVTALGGEATWNRHRSMTIRGGIDSPGMGLTGDLTIYHAAPNRYLVELSIAGVGDFSQGYDGEVGWSIDPLMGAMVLQGKVLRQIQLEADFDSEFRYPEHYPTMETVEQTRFNDQDCYKVRLVDQEGRESHHYFGVDTGLKAGSEGEESTPGGDVFVRLTLDAYKEFAGLLLPARSTQTALGQKTIFTFDEVELDSVEPSVFALPKAIQVLVAGDETEGEL